MGEDDVKADDVKALRDRCDALEAQVRLLWAVLRDVPRLEGIHDTIFSQSMWAGVRPMEAARALETDESKPHRD